MINIPLTDLAPDSSVADRSGEGVAINDASGKVAPSSDATQEKEKYLEVETGIILHVTPTVTRGEVKYHGKLRVVELGAMDAEKGVWNFLESSAYFHERTNDGGTKSITIKAPKGKTVEVSLKLTVDRTEERRS